MNLTRVSATKNRDRIRNLVLPGFEGVPISSVIGFVIKGFSKGVLVTRAS